MNKNQTPIEDRDSRSVKRLVSCLWHLGWHLGWRYWRLQNACIVDPGLALRIAEATEREAGMFREWAASATSVETWNCFTQQAAWSESWAALVRKCHAEHLANVEVYND